MKDCIRYHLSLIFSNANQCRHINIGQMCLFVHGTDDEIRELGQAIVNSVPPPPTQPPTIKGLGKQLVAIAEQMARSSEPVDEVEEVIDHAAVAAVAGF